jgi:hypothetical protein
MAGQRQEHLVQAGLAERERGDPDAGAGELGDDLGAPVGVRTPGRQRADDVPDLVAGARASPVVGSSRNITCGVTTMLAAMSSRRRMPPE